MSTAEQDNREVLVSRIRKLLALGTSSNENEAAAAVNKAQELMFKYNLGLEDLVERKTSEVGEYETSINILVTWQTRLVVTVAQTSLCKVVQSKRRRIINGRYTSKLDRIVIFVGRDHDTALAELICQWLFGELNRLSNYYSDSLKGTLSPAERKVARRSWLEGAAATVSRRLEREFEQRRQANAASTALVIHRDAEVAEYVSKMRLGKAEKRKSNSRMDWAAYLKGTEDGEQVSLRPGEGHKPEGEALQLGAGG